MTICCYNFHGNAFITFNDYKFKNINKEKSKSKMSNKTTSPTFYKGEYLWPYLDSFNTKPSEPSEEVNTTFHGGPIDRKLCDCHRHSWNPYYSRAKFLKEKEKAYRDDMIIVASERCILENDILEHPCTNPEEAITSLYGKDYAKAAYPMADFREMKKVPIVTSVVMLKDPQKTCYRDNSTFKTVAITPPHIQGPMDVIYNTAPQSIDDLYISEYSGTISSAGFRNYRTSQRYRR